MNVLCAYTLSILFSLLCQSFKVLGGVYEIYKLCVLLVLSDFFFLTKKNPTGHDAGF